jgi:hypothetical protein
MRSLSMSLMALLLLASTAQAEINDPWGAAFAPRPGHDPWRVDWRAVGDRDSGGLPVRLLAFPSTSRLRDGGQPLHAAAVEHSDAYRMRAKIHKYASFATLPLFATELALGQSLYNTPSNAGGKRGAHAAVGIGIVSLFGVETVTGAWNMFGGEGRRDTDGRTLRLVHGLLMMAADVGFLATTASGPNSESQREALTFETDKATHRNLAIASISVATAGYLLMLFGNH